MGDKRWPQGIGRKMVIQGTGAQQKGVNPGEGVNANPLGRAVAKNHMTFCMFIGATMDISKITTQMPCNRAHSPLPIIGFRI